MATSSKAAARRSLRPHTTPNVRENLRREKERVLARQAELETLAAPINEAAAQLAKIDAIVDARAAAAQRKIEQLEKARDKRIEKIRAEFAAKIAAARTDVPALCAYIRELEVVVDAARPLVTAVELQQQMTARGVTRELRGWAQGLRYALGKLDNAALDKEPTR